MGKIIRVQKVAKNGSKYEAARLVLSKHECTLWKDAEPIVSSPNKEIAGQLYVQCVMIPLLGSEFVDPGVCVNVVYLLCLNMLVFVFSVASKTLCLHVFDPGDG